MIAYHFCRGTLERALRRDGTILERGGTEIHEGPLVICASGLHASPHPADALEYAPSPILRRVDLRGEIAKEQDKICGRRRRELGRIDATRLLQIWAADCAERVWHLVVPDEQLAAAWAIDAARRRADPEEMAAACDAARAASDVAQAVSDAARAASYAAQAACDTARAAGVAAWSVSYVARAAREAAWAANYATERRWQRKRLRILVDAAFAMAQEGARVALQTTSGSTVLHTVDPLVVNQLPPSP